MRFLRPQDARFPCDQKSLAIGDFVWDQKQAKAICIAGMPAIPESAVKNRQRMAMRDFGALSAPPLSVATLKKCLSAARVWAKAFEEGTRDPTKKETRYFSMSIS